MMALLTSKLRGLQMTWLKHSKRGVQAFFCMKEKPQTHFDMVVLKIASNLEKSLEDTIYLVDMKNINTPQSYSRGLRIGS